MRKSRGISTYSGAHRNVVLKRGFATEHECIRCSGQAAEWAYLHHDPCPHEIVHRGMRCSPDPMRYAPMCRGCHRRYDKQGITHCPAGHEYAEANLILDRGKRKCRACVYARNTARRRRNPMTPEQKQRKLELQRIRRARARETNDASVGRQLLAAIQPTVPSECGDQYALAINPEGGEG